MKTRTAPALTAVLLATVTIIGLAAGGDAVASEIRSCALDLNIESSIGVDIAINNRDIDSIDANTDGKTINVAEIESNINEEDIVQRITNIDNINNIAIADRIQLIEGIGNTGIINIAEINLIGGADGAGISATI